LKNIPFLILINFLFLFSKTQTKSEKREEHIKNQKCQAAQLIYHNVGLFGDQQILILKRYLHRVYNFGILSWQDSFVTQNLISYCEMQNPSHFKNHHLNTKNLSRILSVIVEN
jgi:hypothetical protein